MFTNRIWFLSESFVVVPPNYPDRLSQICLIHFIMSQHLYQTIYVFETILLTNLC